MNPHDVTTTRSLVLLVCQFRHFRVSGVSRFCISHRRILIYHSSFCLASTFLTFFIFLITCFFRSIYTIFSLPISQKISKPFYILEYNPSSQSETFQMILPPQESSPLPAHLSSYPLENADQDFVTPHALSTTRSRTV